MDNHQKLGILLINVGSPEAPSEQAIREYLFEFLTDPAVIRLPKWFWLPVLKSIVLKTRPKKLAAQYQKIWTINGPPLSAITEKQTKDLKMLLKDKNYVVYFAMRYGCNDINTGIAKLLNNDVSKVIILPLFPQYSDSTSGSIQSKVKENIKALNRPSVDFYSIKSFYNNENYIEALSGSIKNRWATQGRGELLLFSYHGLPLSYPDSFEYFNQCQQTTELVAKALKISLSDFKMCFQSRFGFGRWLEPDTKTLLKALPAKGIKKVDIVCPSFTTDCLETLEEVKIQYANAFLKAGGKKFHYIPCLNTDSLFLKLLYILIQGECYFKI